MDAEIDRGNQYGPQQQACQCNTRHSGQSPTTQKNGPGVHFLSRKLDWAGHFWLQTGPPANVISVYQVNFFDHFLCSKKFNHYYNITCCVLDTKC